MGKVFYKIPPPNKFEGLLLFYFMKRLSREEYVCMLALAAATRSEDPFTQSGAALLDIDGNVLGTGVNGLKAGIKVPDWMYLKEKRTEKSQLMLHSEANLWTRKKDGIEHLLGITMSPCGSCAKMIAASKVRRVVYVRLYERGDDEFKKIFDFHGVEYRLLTKDELNNISFALTNLSAVVLKQTETLLGGKIMAV